MKLKLVIAFSLLSTAAIAQDSKAGDVVFKDACDRHRWHMIEMMSGKVADSSDIEEFEAVTTITTHIKTYILYTWNFSTINETLAAILEYCKKDPSRTIGDILFKHDAEITSQMRAEEELRKKQGD